MRSRRRRAPVRIAIAVVITQQVDILLHILGDLQRLVDRVEKLVGEIGRQIDELCTVLRRAKRTQADTRTCQRERAQRTHPQRCCEVFRRAPWANGVLQAAGAAISLLTPKRSCQGRKQSTPVCTILCTCVRRAHGCSRLSAAVCKSAHGNQSSFSVCVRAHSSREKRTRWELHASIQKD